MRFLVKATREAHVQGFVAQWLEGVKVPSSMRLSVDVDPHNFL